MIGQPVVLVGASMGGAAAIDIALTYPEMVDRLVLLDSAGFAAGPAMGKFMFPPLDRWATAFLGNSGVRRRISLQAYHDKGFVTADAETCGALHLLSPGWSEALIGFTKSGGYNFLADKIHQIAMPTLVIWGRQDKILGIKDAARFESHIADATLVWIDDCGHVPHLEKAGDTAEAIAAWL
jgi:pimeloyl-ACP methyl ester carboxylesterase